MSLPINGTRDIQEKKKGELATIVEAVASRGGRPVLFVAQGSNELGPPEDIKGLLRNESLDEFGVLQFEIEEIVLDDELRVAQG